MKIALVILFHHHHNHLIKILCLFHASETKIRNGSTDCDPFLASILKSSSSWQPNTHFIKILHRIGSRWLQPFGISAIRGKTHNFLSGFSLIIIFAVLIQRNKFIRLQIAAASLFISLCLIQSLVNSEKKINYEKLWNPVLEFYSTYNMAYLRPIIKELIAYIQVAPTSKTNNVYVKYTSLKQGEMALICDRSKQILNMIFADEWQWRRERWYTYLSKITFWSKSDRI